MVVLEGHDPPFLETCKGCGAVVGLCPPGNTEEGRPELTLAPPTMFVGGPGKARDVVGMLVVRRFTRATRTVTVVWRCRELEYYGGGTKWPDPASYAARGLSKGEPMLRRPGVVYLAPMPGGNIISFNITAEEEGEPGAWLVAAIDLVTVYDDRGRVATPSRNWRYTGFDAVRTAVGIHPGLQGHDLTCMGELFVATPQDVTAFEVQERERQVIHDGRHWRFALKGDEGY